MFERYDTMFWVMRLLGVLAILAGIGLWFRDANVPTYPPVAINPLRGALLSSAGITLFMTGVFGDLLTHIASATLSVRTMVESEIIRRR
jgi:hypothetical protein